MPGPSRETSLLNRDYKEMLQVLLDEQVEFLVVGAYTMAAHGVPRATGDIDLWVRPKGPARPRYAGIRCPDRKNLNHCAMADHAT